MNTALLIIDMQRTLCRGEYAAFESGRVIDRINQVSGLARIAGATVVVIQHEEPGGPMAFGADAWTLDPDVVTLPTDVFLRKTACDSFHNTGLQALLQSRGIGQLVICGLQSEFCVDSTVRRALALGYPVTLVTDGHSTLDNGVLSAAQITAHHTQTLKQLDNFGPRVHAVAASAVRFEG